MATTQVEIIDLTTKTTTASTDYIIVDNGTTTYKMQVQVLLDKIQDYVDEQIGDAIAAEYQKGNYMTLTELFTDIANAIRSKTGGQVR